VFIFMTMSAVVFTLSSVKLSWVACFLLKYRHHIEVEIPISKIEASLLVLGRGKARESFIVCRWRRQKQRVMRNDNAAMRAVGVHPSISIHNAPRCRAPPWSILGDALRACKNSQRGHFPDTRDILPHPNRHRVTARRPVILNSYQLLRP